MRASVLALVMMLCTSLPVDAARSFSGVSQYLTASAVPYTTHPATIACWMNKPSAVTSGNIFESTIAASTADHRVTLTATNTGIIQFNTRDTVNQSSNTTATYTADVWVHAVGSWRAANSRQSYLDTAAGPHITGTVTMTTQAVAAYAVAPRATPAGLLTGTLGPCSIWNAGLTTWEAQKLAGGIHHRKVASAALISHTPMGLASPDLDFAGYRTWTLTGAPTSVFGAAVGRFTDTFGR